jgi:hypothetical protein
LCGVVSSLLTSAVIISTLIHKRLQINLLDIGYVLPATYVNEKLKLVIFP